MSSVRSLLRSRVLTGRREGNGPRQRIVPVVLTQPAEHGRLAALDATVLLIWRCDDGCRLLRAGSTLGRNHIADLLLKLHHDQAAGVASPIGSHRRRAARSG